ncbi:hypothetical protein PG990_014722 [Apiospora arundinis]|uniref:Uncharacterized protein n=1 Tax=Apiospora arundinis TaxID=335852 RepID=A0ABR2HK53_9PEZI
MVKFNILSLVLFAMMAVLGHGNMEPGYWWSDICKKASLHFSYLTATCKGICSTLDLNHCFGFDYNQGIYAKDE